eukprot:scaffold216226_cov30-Tisochrysis_lutea.AAC.2
MWTICERWTLIRSDRGAACGSSYWHDAFSPSSTSSCAPAAVNRIAGNGEESMHTAPGSTTRTRYKAPAAARSASEAGRSTDVTRRRNGCRHCGAAVLRPIESPSPVSRGSTSPRSSSKHGRVSPSTCASDSLPFSTPADFQSR